eukprot:scaffold41354_cov59-Phaeocystis_antarctica.AAC.4
MAASSSARTAARSSSRAIASASRATTAASRASRARSSSFTSATMSSNCLGPGSGQGWRATARGSQGLEGQGGGGGGGACCLSSSSASLAIASSRLSSSTRLHSSNHAKPSYSPPDDAPGVRGLAPSKLGTRLKMSSSSESAIDASSSFCVCVAHVCRSRARHVTANGLSSRPQAFASANWTSSLIALERMGTVSAPGTNGNLSALVRPLELPPSPACVCCVLTTTHVSSTTF